MTVTTGRDGLPLYLTTAETATLLRTTRKGIYAMVERGLLPGVTRIGRRQKPSGIAAKEVILRCR